MNLVFTLLIAIATAFLATFASDAAFAPGRLAATVGVLLLGTVVFSPMGAAIAYWARPRAASTIVNLVFLPLSFLSGFFFPPSQLPDVLQGVAPWLPTFHFGQARLASDGTRRRRAPLRRESGSAWQHVAIVLVWGLVCTVVTVWGYRRELQRERS